MWVVRNVGFKSFLDPQLVQICKYFSQDVLSYRFHLSALSKTISYRPFLVPHRTLGTKKKFTPFETVIQERRLQAQRSILVQVQSEKSCHDLFIFASQFGTVESMHHYTLPGHSHFVIVEMKDQIITRRILTKCGHLDKNQVIPVRSPFLWFRANKSRNTAKNNEDFLKINCITHNLFPPSEEEVNVSLLECKSLSHQVITLYNLTKMNDINSRLRFLVAYQVELALSGLFPLCVIYPFGSSVNNFGKLGCDLDLVLQLDKQTKEESEECRLMFHCKTSLGSERSQTLRHLETVGDLLQLFLPGCTHVKRILGARVPIIKYSHDMTSLECDLSMTNLTALYMAELLFIFGEIDWRVRPLVFTIKKWAKDVNLTNPAPGRWITNFSLTILVLFYLQAMKILPSIKFLIDQSSAKDKRVAEDGVDCTFLRDLNNLNFHPSLPEENTDSLATLLLGFFEFYSQFDFNKQGISLYLGTPMSKPEYCALYINNPLERGLNVSKNVSLEELERLKIELRNASWTLESTSTNQTGESWGLLELFKKQNLTEKAKHVFFSDKSKLKERLLSVEDLFSADSEEESSDLNENKEQQNVIRKPISAQTLKAVQKTLKHKRR